MAEGACARIQPHWVGDRDALSEYSERESIYGGGCVSTPATSEAQLYLLCFLYVLLVRI